MLRKINFIGNNLKSAKRHTKYVNPSTDDNTCYALSLSLLDSLDLSSVERSYTVFQNHFDFVNGKCNSDMLLYRYSNKVQPLLQKSSALNGIFKDVFPLKQFSSFIIPNYPSHNWTAAYGQHLPPQFSIYSPQVTIHTRSNQEHLYSLLLIDVDCPDISSKSYIQWCHWYIANIKITSSIEIKPGSSPYLTELPELTSNNGNPVFQGTVSNPEIPGDVVFDYVPFHPAHSNPRKQRRYMFVLLKQTEKVDIEELKSILKKRSIGKQSSNLFSAKTSKIQVLERGALGPILQYSKDVKSDIDGYGFVTSGWNIYCPEIFKSLGIHEPVYGKLTVNEEKMFVDKLIVSMDHLKNTENVYTDIVDSASTPYPIILTKSNSQAPIVTKLVDLVNQGKKSVDPFIHKPNRILDKILDDRKNLDDSLVLKKSKKENVTVDVILDQRQERLNWRKSRKVPRMTSVAATGMVKVREVDGAAKMKGEIFEKVTTVKDRYANV